jgi:hypothetical protein
MQLTDKIKFAQFLWDKELSKKYELDKLGQLFFIVVSALATFVYYEINEANSITFQNVEIFLLLSAVITILISFYYLCRVFTDKWLKPFEYENIGDLTNDNLSENDDNEILIKILKVRNQHRKINAMRDNFLGKHKRTLITTTILIILYNIIKLF